MSSTMKRTIKLNEEQYKLIKGSTKLTEYKFYNNVQRFLSDLLKDPVGAQVPFLLQANNIARNYLLYHLKSQGLINRYQKISDKDSQGNPKTAKMIIKYSVPKKDFAKKMKKLFITMVAKNIPEKIEKLVSENEGGAMGATSADASGQFSQPLFGVQRKKGVNDIEETTATTNVGDHQYTVPFLSDDETMDRTPGFSVKQTNKSKRRNQLLNEDRESKNLSKARKVLTSFDSNIDAQKTVELIRNNIPNSRRMNCQFLPGICRMYMNGDFEESSTVRKMNQVLKLLASDAHASEYNQDLNGEDAQRIINRFQTHIEQDIENDKKNVDSTEYDTNSNYEIVKITSFEQAKEYGRYTSWCVTQYENMYNSYTANGDNVFYFCLKDGYKNIKPNEGDDCPKDEYGLSMIAVSVRPDGSLNTSTCRWNHSNGGTDELFSTQELSQIIGRNFYQTFLPLSKEDIAAHKEKQIKICLDNILMRNEFKKLTGDGRYLTNIYSSNMYIVYDTKTNQVVSGDKLFSFVGDCSTAFERPIVEIELDGEWQLYVVGGEVIPSMWSLNGIDKKGNKMCEVIPCKDNDMWNYYDVKNLTWLFDTFGYDVPNFENIYRKLKRKVTRQDILKFNHVEDEINTLADNGYMVYDNGFAYSKNNGKYELYDLYGNVYPKPFYSGLFRLGYIGETKEILSIILDDKRMVLYSLNSHKLIMDGKEFAFATHYKGNTSIQAYETDNLHDIGSVRYHIDMNGKPIYKSVKTNNGYQKEYYE